MFGGNSLVCGKEAVHKKFANFLIIVGLQVSFPSGRYLFLLILYLRNNYLVETLIGENRINIYEFYLFRTGSRFVSEILTPRRNHLPIID